ncbi:hypothetical protein [Actinomadura roseirufa]|uniref:hypothetical protein n=1 Tax=Actinomadura roseirufa TaxID=2094049 RepID=UPI0010417743|nr:hypothetical protein [Actinomadura roseirufa]
MATTAPHYADGEWSSGPELLPSSWQDGDEVTAQLEQLGYELFTTIGGDVPTGTSITVYTRTETPRFFIEISGDQGRSEHVYAAQTHDALELLARYAPIAQAAAISSMAGNTENLDDLLRAMNGR